MTRKMVFWLITVLCTGAAFAQVLIPDFQAASGPQANKSPVAYVYVNGSEDTSSKSTALPPIPREALVGYPGVAVHWVRECRVLGWEERLLVWHR